MNTHSKPEKELISLNEELHTEFSIQELEQRLETDPLMAALMADGCTLDAGDCTLTYCENPGANVFCEIKYIVVSDL